MRKPKGRRFLAVAALCSGLALAAAAPAIAIPTPAASAPASAAQPPLTVDKSLVHPGNTLLIKLNHGPEQINWISSAAFVRTRQNPADPNEGLAQIVHDENGQADAVATIDNVPPGTYTIGTRVGGGNGPDLTITVVE